MKKILFIGLTLLCMLQNVIANGICILNGNDNSHLPLISSDIKVSVNNQIASVTVTQVFFNDTNADTLIKFAYPMSETAGVLQLRWNNFGTWFTADFAPNPQDTILPGGGGSGNWGGPIREYLGDYPLYFNLQQYVPAGGVITFELTYVDLLPYAFNVVEFFHPNDYSSLQTTPLDTFLITFNLFSDRTIDWLELENYSDEVIVNNGNDATLTFSKADFEADQDLIIHYQLNANELGLFSFSTFIADTLLYCDENGEGFMAFIVEPDPSNNTQVIDKIFTLIIDQSGSMSGEKMEQARDAASFIVNHLNEGDYFNIIAFQSTVTSFKPNHIPFDAISQNEALDFISNLNSGGSTNISGAFSATIPQFANSDPDKAQIIIFFTDGEATVGIQDTPGILQHVTDLVNAHEVQSLSIFTFGIGAGINQQLLTLLALQNNGLSEFLGVEELLETITNFYLTIQNPVLLNTDMFFNPELVIETYPTPLPNLFKGQQLIVVGRYMEPDSITVHFSGTAFGDQVNYDYGIQLSDTLVADLQFLPRLWAKRKIENLYFQFYAAPSGSPEAMALEDSIINISLCYGVISPFTSFEDNSGGGVTLELAEVGNPTEDGVNIFPNPFLTQTEILFQIPAHKTSGKITVEIWTVNGVLIRELLLPLDNSKSKHIIWDGQSFSGAEVASGMYFIIIKIDGEIYNRARLVKG
jgi:Ca-activated chloride channel homolog